MKEIAASERRRTAREDSDVPARMRPMLRSRQEGQELIASGWAAADLHVHTWCSYDVAPVAQNDPLRIYEKALCAGMSYVTFTDHDTMDAYDRVGWTREHVVPGVEIKILDRRRVGHTVHVNVYGLDLKAFGELEDLAASGNIETFISALRSLRLPYGYNHPFWHEPTEKLNIRGVFDLMPLFPVLEYNMGRVLPLNLIAADASRRLGKGLVGSSDTHSGCVAEAYTLARGATFSEFMAEIVAGRSLVVPQDLTLDRLAAEVFDRLRCLFELESWEFAKPGFNLETGIALLDERLQPLLLDPMRKNSRLKKALRWVMTGLANSRIPHSFYIRSQNLLAESIRQFLPA
ncbi:MAG: PHP domain-containing protein [Candidatus Aminicenantes bacterium]|nr:PHP domain-containing protein [Candidatus Aminicenantes bacterium]